MLPPSGENHAASPRHIGSTSAGPPSTGTVYTRSKSDRKSTRLNSSHGYISYAVFCLKKKIDRILALLPPAFRLDVLELSPLKTPINRSCYSASDGPLLSTSERLMHVIIHIDRLTRCR